MQNKILFITNRGVRPGRTGVTLFKNMLNKNDERLNCAELVSSKHEKNKFFLNTEQPLKAFIQQQVSSAPLKPWVFFIHGNNQTLNKNLKKCEKLRDLYDVNIIAFSWPSVHYGKIRNLLNYIPRNAIAGKYIKRQLLNKMKQYRKAKKNAKGSADDLIQSIELSKSCLRERDFKVSFVAHSLGNLVLEYASNKTSLSELFDYFHKVVLHQADVDEDQHRLWVDTIGKSENVVVTINKNDKVLEVSNLYNHRSLGNKRLGNVRKSSNDGSPLYKDFTGEKGIGWVGHTLFLTKASKNQSITSFFRSLFHPPA